MTCHYYNLTPILVAEGITPQADTERHLVSSSLLSYNMKHTHRAFFPQCIETHTYNIVVAAPLVLRNTWLYSDWEISTFSITTRYGEDAPWNQLFQSEVSDFEAFCLPISIEYVSGVQFHILMNDVTVVAVTPSCKMYNAVQPNMLRNYLRLIFNLIYLNIHIYNSI